MEPSPEFRTFRDRRDAGKQLAQRLARHKGEPDTLVLALPRGGVVLGYEISTALRLPLDVLITRKLGTPGNPELAMGAIAETGYRHVNEDVMREHRISQEDLIREVRRQEREIQRRIERYRQGRPLLPMKGRTVILVDDGIATGATFYASLGALVKADAARVVAAVPVAPPRALTELKRLVEEAVVLYSTEWFFGISQFYDEFPQVEDEEVIACLEQARLGLSEGA